MDGGLTGGRFDPATGRRDALRILLSAYACEPLKGSEPGVGWHWAMALARSGHEVWVITRANNRDSIERALRAEPRPHPSFMYYDLPAWGRWWKSGSRGVRLYYVLWQWGAYRAVRQLNRVCRFDIVHHITFGVFRHPSFMAFLGVPFVFGPLGGGEVAPPQLRETFPLRGRVLDAVRDFANRVARIDPLMAAIYRRSAAILCKTRETLHAIPEKYREKCLIQVEVGTDAPHPDRVRREPRDKRQFQVLYVGRLIYWKGLHLGLRAFAQFSATHPDARLTVIGGGRDERWLRGIAHRLGIASAVTWMPWLERSQVMQAYAQHDAFLFPSLHDSSGNVVLEAMCCEVPVICLEVGGPAALVDSSCGFRVGAGEPHRVVDGLARALAMLAENPALGRTMGEAGARRARQQFSWARQVTRMEGIYFALCSGRPVTRIRERPIVRRGAG
jgi:glycosyltransferase involved in cell wall biosynthesis